jgi:peroxiredoxin
MGDHNGMKMAKRNTFLIDPVQVWTAVNPQQHSEQVLAALSGYEKK